MRGRKPPTCSRLDCTEQPHLGGLCREHYTEKRIAEDAREAAIQMLHKGVIDGELPKDSRVQDELSRLRPWWDKACICRQTRSGRPFLPYDESESAMEWCIGIAQQLIEHERIWRSGKPSVDIEAYRREHFWDRFRSLEAGLRSNGTPRDTEAEQESNEIGRKKLRGARASRRR